MPLLTLCFVSQSNEWAGKDSFGGRSLHSVGETPNPYEEAISSIGQTLAGFDDDDLIPCYGFGDSKFQAFRLVPRHGLVFEIILELAKQDGIFLKQNVCHSPMQYLVLYLGLATGEYPTC